MSNPTPSIWSRLFSRRITFLVLFVITAILLAVEAEVSERILHGRPLFLDVSWIGISLSILILATALATLLSFLCFILPTSLRQRIFNKRVLRAVLFRGACVLTLIGLFYAIENWRGRRAWNRYTQEVTARGESLNIADMAPAPIPAGQNLALCPLFQPIFDWSRTKFAGITYNNTNGLARLDRLDLWWSEEQYIKNGPRDDPSFTALRDRAAALQSRKFETTNGWTDLSLWQEYYRVGTNLNGIPATNSPAMDVLLALRSLDNDITELQREARSRPLSRWPIEYDEENAWGILLPHLAKVKRLTHLLKVRAAANFAAGNVDSGLEELNLGFRMADSVKDEPLLVSHLVRMMFYDELIQGVKEGLARHQFSDAQLVELQRIFAATDFLTGYNLAMRSERALNSNWAVLTPDEISMTVATFNPGIDQLPVLLYARFAPKGWILQNQLRICRIYDDHLLPAVNIESRSVHPERMQGAYNLIASVKGPYSILVSLSLSETRTFGNADSWLRGSAKAQTKVDQALVACALERHHLQHKRYPDKLESLVPQFINQLPKDVLGGKPLNYRPTDDGRYILYAVGWNESDDNGKPVFRDGNSVDEQGDWVWQLPSIL